MGRWTRATRPGVGTGLRGQLPTRPTCTWGLRMAGERRAGERPVHPDLPPDIDCSLPPGLELDRMVPGDDKQPGQVLRIIKKLPDRKGTGVDIIGNEALEMVGPIITPYLENIFAACLVKCHYPNFLTLSRIEPQISQAKKACPPPRFLSPDRLVDQHWQAARENHPRAPQAGSQPTPQVTCNSFASVWWAPWQVDNGSLARPAELGPHGPRQEATRQRPQHGYHGGLPTHRIDTRICWPRWVFQDTSSKSYGRGCVAA